MKKKQSGILASGLLLLLFGAQAMSQTVEGSISSGQHETFSRLVLTFQTRPAWELREGPSPELVFDAAEIDLDTSDAFSRIDRSRIADVEVSSGTLRLRLACECDARAFELGERRIVLDIVDAAPDDETAVEMATDPSGVADGPDRFSPVQIGYLPAALGLLPRPDRRFGSSSPSDAPPRLVAPAAPEAPNPDIPLGELDRKRADMRASTGGPITFRAGRSRRDIELLSEALATASARGITDAPGLIDEIDRTFQTAEGRPGLSVRSVFDLGAADNVRVASADAICQPRHLHDIAAWEADDDLTLGALRASVVDEKARLVPSQIHRLTQYYLTRGFGAEAERLQSYLDAADRRPAYLALAEILDHGSTASDVFKDQFLCPNGAALWAVFSDDLRLSDLAGGNPAILRTFSALPPALRLQLGQELSDRLRKAGRLDDAGVVLNAVARTGSRGLPDYRQAASQLGLGGRETQLAIERLERMVKSTDATAGEALVALLEYAGSSQEKPKAVWIENAEPLIRANRGNQTSERLRTLWLHGLIDTGEFAAARDAYYVHREDLGRTDRQAVRASLATSVSEAGSDADVLEIVALLALDAEDFDLGPSATARLSERLVGMGADGDVFGLSPSRLPIGVAERDKPVRPQGVDFRDETQIDPLLMPRSLLDSVAERKDEITRALERLEF